MTRYGYWIGLAAATVMDVALAALLTFWIGGTDTAVTFGFILALLVLAPALYAAWRLIRVFVIYKLFAKQASIQQFIAIFAAADFPQRQFVADLDTYLSETAGDNDVPVETRLKAAEMQGLLSGFRTSQPIAMGMPMHLAAEAALHEYLKMRFGRVGSF